MRLQYVLPLLLSFVYHGNLFAQKNTTLTVKAGTTIKESVAMTDLFEYPQFTQGTVFFRNGKHSGAALNYDRFSDEMLFITAKGDTLALSDEKNIDFINIGTDTFYYNQGYIKLVTSTANLKLAIKQMLWITDKKKMGAYGMTSSTSAIDSYNSINDGVKSYDLTVMQDILLEKRVQYFIGDGYNRFVLMDKKNILNFYPKHHQAILDYFKENNVVFNNKQDVENLVQFLTQL